MTDDTPSALPSPPSGGGGRRLIPYGGQVLIVMIAHALITVLASGNLTVLEFIAEEPDVEAQYAMIDLVGNAITLLLGISFWLLGWRRAFRRTAVVYLILSTLVVLMDCFNLVSTLTARAANTESAFALLWDAVLTWGNNVLTFGVWYWLLDQGGPDKRNSPEPDRSDIAFPQQTADLPGWEGWQPRLLDYLFVSFTTSLAFSPTDTVILSIRAKILSMLQASIAITIVAMLAARVVNTIQ